jgi:hypothetical protein
MAIDEDPTILTSILGGVDIFYLFKIVLFFMTSLKAFRAIFTD